MVSVRSIARVLLVATLASSAVSMAAADDVVKTEPKVATQTEESCLAPSVVAQLETQLDELKQTNAEWAVKLEAATGAWETEKALLVEKIAEKESTHEAATQALAVAKTDAEAKLVAVEATLKEGQSEHMEALSALQKQVAALEATVAELKKQLSSEKETVVQRNAEVSEARAKLAKVSTQVKSLERDVAQSRKNNAALRDELAKMDEKLTMAALLSSYYDEGVVLASKTVTALQEQIAQAQNGTSSLSEVLTTIEDTKKTILESTDKLYAEHLAATLDPVIADLRTATEPYVTEYRPVVEAELTKAQQAVADLYEVGVARAHATRGDAVTLLKQNESVAPYAQTIVDGSLVILALPIAFFAIRLALRFVWWVLSTVLCVATFGFCCGKCAKKRSKLKRKMSRKQLTTAAKPAAPAASTQSLNGNGSATRRATKKNK
ncbi:hypothetical protein Poli38472_000934 [Pythium oligandrum]|uniref:Uncharacterized protein n=1 Tax=Pythium oligandrum TaxID=41045 RepID=A0A8K1CCU6_PYTOL|nr:hypothetical protein Poli38472_000934 [Pythium oligandrum]|eukprot:TMW60892.1 hypothetical protein Poli38472_000934 [Pythium oligandrum]